MRRGRRAPPAATAAAPRRRRDPPPPPTADQKPGDAADEDRRDLARARGRERRQPERHDGDSGPRPVWRKAARHAQDRLSDDGDRDELEPVEQPLPRRPAERVLGGGEERQGDRGGQREPGPGRDPAENPGPPEPDRKDDLAARRPGQELAEGDEVGVGPLVEPPALDHEGVAEIAEMRHRPAEARQAQPKKHAQDFERRPVFPSGLPKSSRQPACSMVFQR